MIATAVPLMAAPWGHTGPALVVIVALPLVAKTALSSPRRAPEADPVVVVLGGDRASLTLLRRTEPALRMRRPAVAIDAQIRWRQAAEARRWRRDIPS